MRSNILITVIVAVFVAIVILMYVHSFNSGGNGSGTSTIYTEYWKAQATPSTTTTMDYVGALHVCILCGIQEVS